MTYNDNLSAFCVKPTSPEAFRLGGRVQALIPEKRLPETFKEPNNDGFRECLGEYSMYVAVANIRRKGQIEFYHRKRYYGL